jgi:hypothetical protein
MQKALSFIKGKAFNRCINKILKQKKECPELIPRFFFRETELRFHGFIWKP